MLLPLAHAGHWLVQAVYFLPVLAFLIWLGISQLKMRREGDGEPDSSPPE